MVRCFRMGTDYSQMSSTDLLRQRLIKCGVPDEYVEQGQPGLVAYARCNNSKLQGLISALLPGPEEIQAATSSATAEETRGGVICRKIKDQFRESIKWVQWLMFEEEPRVILEDLGRQSGGTRGVCGAVWGSNDIAYRCRTCEHDPTCAICVPCFQAGNHINHDYSMIHTGGGCCDCGDETAWKPEGFCSRHKGPGQVQPLPSKLANSVNPVLGALLVEWKERLLAAERVIEGRAKKWEQQTVQEKVAHKTTSVIVEMLLSFCKCSESLLNFTATLMGSSPEGLLDILLRAERFLHKTVVEELHELLFKLLGEPNFKYEFAKAFIRHYPTLISEAIRESIDGSNSNPKPIEYPVLGNFSVQIFTVPTLTPRLVTELNLLDMLLGSLKQLFISCAGEDDRLLASKGPISNQLYMRLVEDIRYVMSHLEVAKYVASERPDLSKAWIQLLAFMQGMDPQKRVTSIHVEEESDHWLSSFILEYQMANIHSLYVAGAASVYHVKWMDNRIFHQISAEDDSDDDAVVVRHAKIGRLSEESSVVRMVGRSSALDMEIREAFSESTCALQGSGLKSCSKDTDLAMPPVPAALIWLISECIKILDYWLGVDTAKDWRKTNYESSESFEHSFMWRAVQWKGRGVRGLARDVHAPTSGDHATRQVDTDTITGRGAMLRNIFRRGRRIASADARTGAETDGDRAGRRTVTTTNDNFHGGGEIDIDMTGTGIETSKLIEECSGEPWVVLEVDNLGVLKLEDWPFISYDVSRQDISFHIPLHRMLSLLLHRAMELYTGEHDQSVMNSFPMAPFSGNCHAFFGQMLSGCHPSGFSAFVMEHPLRLQVFCAQVRAGMWRRNGHSTQALCDHYHSVRWCEDSLEHDLFLLQCCAAMAPPEAFVHRILERFGLSDYLSLHLIRSNEYEPTLAQEMLALIIRIVAERGFCGLSATETLRRELVRKLAVGDATRSQLLKALPPRLSDNKNLQEILDSVATYAHPSGMQQGKYSLRKDYWKELDLYHPRWNSRNLQVAEERYSRFCKASAMVLQLPRWKKLFPPFNNISQIATSRGVLQIIRAVLFYAVFSENSAESRAPDGVLFTALHLLALGLDICSLTANKEIQMQKNEISLQGCKMSTLSEQNESTFLDPTISCHGQELPPLLAYAKEVIYVGDMGRPEVSNHQSLLSLLVLLMQKYGGGSERGIVSEGVHCNMVALVRSLLEKFAELHSECAYEIQKRGPGILHHLSIHGSRGTGNTEISTYPSDEEKKRALARERQAAIMAKMKAAQAKFVASLNLAESVDTNSSEGKHGRSSVEVEGVSDEAASVVCSLCRELGSKSPTALLTLVQKSRLLSVAERGTPSWKKSTRKNGDDLATNDRGGDAYGNELDMGSGEMISTVEFFHLIQNALDGNHDGLEVEGLLDILRIQLPLNPRNSDHDIVSNDSNASILTFEDTVEGDYAVEEDTGNGKDPSLSAMVDDCSDSTSMARKGMVGGSGDVISTVLAEYLAAVSRVMSEQQQSPENVPAVLSSGASLITSQASAFDGFGPSDCDGIHLSSCEHAVHQECLDRYLSSLRQRYSSRIIFEGVHIVDPDQGEFLCPVCRRLANSVLPVLPVGKNVISTKQNILSSGNTSTTSYPGSFTLRLQQASSLLQNAEDLVGKPGFRKAVSWKVPESTKLAVESLFHKLCTMYFPEKGSTKTPSGIINQSLLLWDVFRYSLLSAELAARSAKLDAVARGTGTSLEALYRAVNSSKGSVLSLLLQVAEATQSQNRLTVLLRSRGMQLFVGSISYGVSRDALSENSLTGNITSLLKHIDNGKGFSDIQFWRRASDPVLVHDPFSSLVWLLFCLPLPFLSEMESFIHLVHLFYLVCVVQAIAYAGRSISPQDDFKSDSHSFIKSVVTLVTGTVLSQSYLEIDDVNLSACPTKVVIRRLTLPYLRRCALLYKLLDSSAASPHEGADGWERSTLHMIDDYRENGNEIFIELEELQQLERFFQIPSLEAILEDKNVHNFALKWCQHLCKETGTRSYRHVARPLPASPFELMRLPHIYQDLLQCYIKERCPTCKSIPDQPALCLLCGTLCCAPSRRSCCGQNECHQHAMTCGAGIGVFLMIRRTNILLQRSTRQAPWPSPYLDAFGEEDYDMQRGKPLYLSKERYAALTHMVVSHGLDHSSHVLLQTTRDTVFII